MLTQLEFIDRHEVVHFLGQPGCGKTHLAIALGVEAVRAGRSVMSLANAEREGSLRERLRFCAGRGCSSSMRSAACRSPPARQSLLPAGQRPTSAAS
jgi:hypothetical protein